jgi:hypothetical protein
MRQAVDFYGVKYRADPRDGADVMECQQLPAPLLQTQHRGPDQLRAVTRRA